jgi:hypothetical protein
MERAGSSLQVLRRSCRVDGRAVVGQERERSRGSLHEGCGFGVHAAPPVDRSAMKRSTTEASQTVTRSPSLKGSGNFPSRTQRQTVEALTGSNPAFLFVVAISATRKTRCDIDYPFVMRRSTTWSNHFFKAPKTLGTLIQF